MSKTQNKNTMIKILALFISILMWSYVRGEVNPKAIREFKGVNVEFINERILNDAGLVVLNPKDTKVSVKISGRRSDINSVELEDITAQVDLSGASIGSQRILINVAVPFKVDLEDVSERYVSIEIDSLSTIQRQVEINASKEGILISESSISPKVIDISGPSTLLSKVSKVIVDIDIDKINQHGILKLPVKVIDKKGKEIEGLQTNPGIVEVSVSLLKSKQVPIKPNLYENPDGVNSREITISPTTVTIRGTEKDLKNVKEIETEAIDISNIGEADSVEAKLILPEGITLDSGENKITLKIEKNKVTTKTISIPVEQINIKNLKDDLISSFYDKSSIKDISVVLRGDISELSSKDINLELDLEGLEEGTHDVELIITPIKDVEFINIEPKIIKIQIQQNS